MMEVTKVLTSVFVLCLSGPTFGYPFTRSGGNLFSATHPGGEASVAGGPRGGHQQQQLPAHLEDYLANYVQGAAAAAPARQFPQYQPSQAQAYQQGYIAQAPQPKLTAETLAALLPYLSSSSGASLNGVSASGPSDYVWEMPDYPSAAAVAGPPAYTDDDGTWYDDMAAGQAQVFNNEPSTMMRAQDEEEQAVLQLLLDHLNGRYSLDDLEAMEREAEMEENTESQLQSLMNKKMVKKSMGGAVAGVSLGHSGHRAGQKEEAPLMPATSVRRPVWGPGSEGGPAQHQGADAASHRQSASSEASGTNTETKRSISEQSSTLLSAANTAQQGNTNSKVSDSSSSSSSTPASASSSGTASTGAGASNSDDHSQADSVVGAQGGTTMTPRLQTAYDALKNYLDRERKFRQEQDDLAEMAELTEPSRGGIQKRFAPDEDALSQQLVNLKKNHT